ncbi:MAG: hypothetical protein JWM68_1098 [Verrucomicrobiales bacterium]|nr:hypothetical protein [Verrucomicrobiales bacterium]
MQKNLSLLLACAVVVLLAICLVQSFQISDQKVQLIGVRDIVSTNVRQIKTLEATVNRLESQRILQKKAMRNIVQQNTNLGVPQKTLTTIPLTSEGPKDVTAPLK